MTKDLGEMTWGKAKKACENLGDEWRLPTKDELQLMYDNKEMIGGFVNNYYWCSEECDNDYGWLKHLGDGNQCNLNKVKSFSVRAVRSK